eukprot:GHVP01055879.1.p1 GENE.GHVP01055879.1~~GHVP01055879.1.p1  ORF type:complete len:256 (+),score=24.11 GHVP01055879.1:434-1201(+)
MLGMQKNYIQHNYNFDWRVGKATGVSIDFIISLDHVGPRVVHGKGIRYIVIIDHATRFLVSSVVNTERAEETVLVFKKFWFALYGAPVAVLTDRGAAFASAVFRDFVMQEMAAHHVFTSPAYPKGNAINESSHKGIEATLKARLQYDTWTDFVDMLISAALDYNATPHSAIGLSPYESMFGKDMVFPGWQQRISISEGDRRQLIREDSRRMMKALMRSDEGWRLRRGTYEVGGLVVYFLAMKDPKIKDWLRMLRS